MQKEKKDKISLSHTHTRIGNLSCFLFFDHVGLVWPFFFSRKAYHALTTSPDMDRNWIFVWKNSAPRKVLFFAWLLAKDRLPTRKNLHMKMIVPSPTCEICNLEEETASHLFLHCPFAASFWASLRLSPGINDIKNMSDINPVDYPGGTLPLFLPPLPLGPMESSARCNIQESRALPPSPTPTLHWGCHPLGRKITTIR